MSDNDIVSKLVEELGNTITEMVSQLRPRHDNFKWECVQVRAGASPRPKLPVRVYATVASSSINALTEQYTDSG